MLPFTSTQFFDLFGIYNNAIWPIQVAAYALAFLAMAMLLRPRILTMWSVRNLARI